MSQLDSNTENAFRVLDEAELDRVNGGDAPTPPSGPGLGINLESIRAAIAVVITTVAK
jgi:hypothetical protein